MAGLPGKAKKVTIFVGQTHGERGQQYVKIMERLQAEGASGATAFASIAAFGARDRVQTLRLAEIKPDLPVMIVWIDTPERVERILPHIQSMVAEGLIAVEESEVTLYTTSTMPRLPAAVTVGDVMTRDVVVVHTGSPMAEVVRDLLERGIRSVPVVDDLRRVAGIITNGDLVRRGGLPVRLELLRTFDTPGLHETLARLGEEHREAYEIMTSPVITVHPDLDVRHAAQLMRRRRLKRLPVVDEEDRIAGIVSRADLLRAVAVAPAQEAEIFFPRVHAEGDSPVRTVMSRDVPIVREDDRLPAILEAVLSTRLNRVVVVDEGSHVLGIITDAELLDRLTPEEHAGALATLMQRVPFAHPSGAQHGGNAARDLMLTDIVVARDDQPVRDVLEAMLRSGRKIVPVVDAEDRLVGVVDRADLLSALVEDA